MIVFQYCWFYYFYYIYAMVFLTFYFVFLCIILFTFSPLLIRLIKLLSFLFPLQILMYLICSQSFLFSSLLCFLLFCSVLFIFHLPFSPFISPLLPAYPWPSSITFLHFSFSFHLLLSSSPFIFSSHLLLSSTPFIYCFHHLLSSSPFIFCCLLRYWSKAEADGPFQLRSKALLLHSLHTQWWIRN